MQEGLWLFLARASEGARLLQPLSFRKHNFMQVETICSGIISAAIVFVFMTITGKKTAENVR